MASGTFLQVATSAGIGGAPGTSSFREWIRNTRNTFSSCSWVNTNPFGAIDATTATPRIVANVSAGYDVFRTNDVAAGGGSGSFPIFVRVDYASGGDSFGRNVQYILTVGTTHDGSGTIGPAGRTLSVRNNSVSAINTTPTSGTTYYYGDSGSIAMSLFIEVANATFGFYLDKTRDVSGNITDEGIVVQSFGGASTPCNGGFYPRSPTGSITTYACLVALGSTQSPSTVQGRTNISPIYQFGGNRGVLDPSPMMLLCKAGDFGNYANATVNVYGINRNYVQMGPNLGSNAAGDGTRTVNSRLLMLWE
jgi:hypothetical protein